MTLFIFWKERSLSGDDDTTNTNDWLQFCTIHTTSRKCNAILAWAWKTWSNVQIIKQMKGNNMKIISTSYSKFQATYNNAGYVIH